MSEYASNGKANAGLTTGIIGTSLAGLLWANGGFGGSGVLGGLFGGRNGGSPYSQSYDGKISQLEAEIAFLRGENYSDKVANEVYKSLDEKINTNLEKLYGFVIDLDKRTALNAQGLQYENTITNNRIDYEKRIAEMENAAIYCYVNSKFVPGNLVMPLSSICPPAAPATTTTGA
jgi:hypothetical protein